MVMIKVYIASPYTLGRTSDNVRRQHETADELIKHGYAPFMPLLNHYQDLFSPHSEEVWLKLDMIWLRHCDILLRLAGKSKGADAEVKYAKKLCIPVVYSVEEVYSIVKRGVLKEFIEENYASVRYVR
jgi:hypothetical protein